MTTPLGQRRTITVTISNDGPSQSVRVESREKATIYLDVGITTAPDLLRAAIIEAIGRALVDIL